MTCPAASRALFIRQYALFACQLLCLRLSVFPGGYKHLPGMERNNADGDLPISRPKRIRANERCRWRLPIRPNAACLIRHTGTGSHGGTSLRRGVPGCTGRPVRRVTHRRRPRGYHAPFSGLPPNAAYLMFPRATTGNVEHSGRAGVAPRSEAFWRSRKIERCWCCSHDINIAQSFGRTARAGEMTVMPGRLPDVAGHGPAPPSWLKRIQVPVMPSRMP